jgi:predicted lipoprotein with Yx(FWY)xxD motif
MRRAILMWLAAAAATALLAACGAGTPTGSSGSSAAVKVGTATVNGSSEQVLTNSSGYTLYYFAIDTPTTSKCTGTCASFWPPVLYPSGQPTSAGSLSGTLAAVSDANGRQVQYNGHFLYRYSRDTAPGQATGNGINLNGGVWFAATPTLAMAGTGTSPSASPSSSGYSSGY